MKKTFYTSIIFVTALAVVLTACGNQQAATSQNGASGTAVATDTGVSPDAVIAEGHFVPARDASLSFQGGGTVTQVSVKVGDKIREGQLLARLGDESDPAYTAAQLELISAQQAFDDLQEMQDEARAQAVIAIDDAEEARDKAQDYYDSLFKPYKYYKISFKYIYLPGKTKRIPVLKKVKVDKGDDESIADAQADLDLKQAQLDEAQRVYDRTKDGPDTKQLALLQARLNAAEAGVAAFEITAPFNGEIMDINVAVGEQLSPGMWAVKVADTSAWYVETSDLTELEIVDVAKEQKVQIVADALPDIEMTGTVNTISQAFTTQGGDILYQVKVQMDDIDPRVKWGMTVEATFQPLAND